MMEPVQSPAPLKGQAVRALVKETMMVQQSQLLTIAEENTLKALREEQKKNQRTLIDTINL